jgi:hypothetical protein
MAVQPSSFELTTLRAFIARLRLIVKPLGLGTAPGGAFFPRAEKAQLITTGSADGRMMTPLISSHANFRWGPQGAQISFTERHADRLRS